MLVKKMYHRKKYGREFLPFRGNAVIRETGAHRTNEVFKKIVEPIIADIGKGKLRRRHAYFDLYCDIQNRLDYLHKVEDYHRSKASTAHLEEDFLDSHTCFQSHLRFVRDCQRRLDINNTIDHVASNTESVLDDDTLILLDEWKSYKQFWTQIVCDGAFCMPHKPTQFKDDVALALIEGQEKMRRSMYIQRLNNACKIAHESGWFFVFDTLTLAPDKLSQFNATNTGLRDYTRNIGRKVNAALGRKAKDSYTDVYQYFMVPEYGDKNGRLHFHCLHMMKALPAGTTDPNYGRTARNYRKVPTMQGMWGYGHSEPIAVRYADDAYTRSGWLIPLDKNNKPLELKPIDAVVRYVAKYVSKNTDKKINHKLERSKSKWKLTLGQQKLAMKMYRVRMSRGFGMTVAPMSHLSVESLRQLSKMHYRSVNNNLLLRESSRRELCKKMAGITLNDLIQTLPPTKNLLVVLRDSMRKSGAYNLVNSTVTSMQMLSLKDISNETLQYLEDNGYAVHPKQRFDRTYGTK